MRISTIVLTATALLLASESAHAKSATEPGGGGFVPYKHSKVGKDYYVVRKGQSDQCLIVPAKWGNRPEGAIGSAPYATKEYAKAALKTFPECKGGEASEASDHKKHLEK